MDATKSRLEAEFYYPDELQPGSTYGLMSVFESASLPIDLSRGFVEMPHVFPWQFVFLVGGAKRRVSTDYSEIRKMITPNRKLILT